MTIITGIRFKKVGRTTFVLFDRRTLITGNAGDGNNDSDSSSVNSNNDFDPSNGHEVDNSQEVARNFYGDREGLNNYFEEKETSIRSALESDMQATRGTEFDNPQYINQLVSDNHTLLAELERSKDTIRDLADIPLSEPSSDSPQNFPQDSSEVERTDFMSGFDEEDN